VRELAGLPGLLGRVDASVLELPADEEPVPAGVLPALLRDVRREQRHRTWLTVGAAAAAAVVVGTAAFTVAGLNDSDGGTTAAPSVTSSSTVTGRPMTPVGAATGIRATLGLTSVDWGTKLELTCSYPRGTTAYEGGAYAMVVHTKDGRTERVASWNGLPGKVMQVSGATNAWRDDITSVEVTHLDGAPIARLKL
jgi:hypothetical protein